MGHANSEVCRVCKQEQQQGEAMGYCTLKGRYVGNGDCRRCNVLCMGSALLSHRGKN